MIQQSHSIVQETYTWRYESAIAIAGLNSQSKAPNRWAWSNNHTQMSRNQTDGGISQAMPTLVWTHSSNLQTCEHDPTITLNCPGNKQMAVWLSYWPSLVWTHSPNMQTCEHDPTITIKMSRKQTDGGMSQLLAIAGLDSQSKDANMWAWSHNHNQDVQKTNRWRYESAIGHRWSGLTVQRCKHVSMISQSQSRCPENKRMEVWVSYWPSLVWTHSPKLQTCEHDLTITLRCPEIKQMEVWVSCLPLVVCTQLFAIAVLESQCKDANMWTWSNDHARLSRKQTDADLSQAMPTLVWTHSSNLQTCEHDPTITLNCPENKQMEVCVSYWPSLVWTHSPKMQTCEHDLTITVRCPENKRMEVWVSYWPSLVGLTVQSSKHVSMI